MEQGKALDQPISVSCEMGQAMSSCSGLETRQHLCHHDLQQHSRPQHRARSTWMPDCVNRPAMWAQLKKQAQQMQAPQ